LNTSLDPNLSNISAKYPWYYLNTYITNKTHGQIFIVDGQQRLTTITLILIALHALCPQFDSPALKSWLHAKIAGVGVGGVTQFWMADEKRRSVMDALLRDDVAAARQTPGITARYMTQNFELVDAELRNRLDTRHRFQSFVYYFLCMVVIVNLDVPQTDVSMVFEVINDRGIGLQPYEIFKGKLLGEIDKLEVDTFADLWENCILPLEADDPGAIDTFFRTYLRAKFAASKKQGQAFDGAYHRAIFTEKSTQPLQLHSNPAGVKSFLKGEFRYYSRLFIKARELGQFDNKTSPECYYISQLNRMDGHLMLTLAACDVDEREEDEKIAAVAKAFDKAYVMLQLNRAYDSNQFQELLYSLNPQLRGCKAADIGKTIEAAVLKRINDWRSAESATLLAYNQFKDVGYGDYNPTFLRYFLARIEKYIADGIGLGMKTSLYNYVRGVGKSNAYHVEHILARNPESKALFTFDGRFEEIEFENQRNRLGGLVLLKGQDNQSSKNEVYKEKLRTYTGSAPYLAQTLVADFYKSNSAIKSFKVNSGLQFASIEEFDKQALESRCLLMYEIAKRVWS